ncbi:IS3 family transposase [Bacillus salipaludis]|uniref:IS3 family transposase n=1 Tax=Bacillus salipaludis TaxID=2547811 RepID=A0AA90QZE3_9BACI|nr:IS3 family transposase [Bacillus salipaludis]MDQ6596525.1 IS3 family transposase [Bacillus salipaludis]
MSKKTFTEKEIIILSKNPYVKSVSSKGITYSHEFKQHFVSEFSKGKFSRQIFEEAGFDVEIIGMQRIKSASERWRAAYKAEGVFGLKDTRKDSSGRPRLKELTIEEKYARLEAQMNLVKAENEPLKKDSYVRKGAEKVKLPVSQKYILIREVIEKYNLRHMVKFLCEAADVSRSGYYNYFSAKSEEKRKYQEAKDEEAKAMILKDFHFKSRKKGARQIKMTLAGQFQCVFNLKKIRRIMKKYNIVCPIRKANPYRRMMKATQEHRVAPNLLNRQFKQETPGKVLLTDITYLNYHGGQRAYLSVIKDGSTGEVLAHYMLSRITMELATNTLTRLKKNRNFKQAKDALIHSDQGTHYTHPDFQKLVRNLGLRQSMSRRGNCWDNAPIESFFGHLKDEVDINTCKTIEELQREIDKYMRYYNQTRYQWNLKKMTPVQYRNHLLQVA